MIIYCFKSFPAILKLPAKVKWLKFNFRSEGFYIVHYDVEGWKDLIEALQNVTVLPCEDRAALINNIFALSR